jgi:uncharacterized protein (TIGR02246 family)
MQKWIDVRVSRRFIGICGVGLAACFAAAQMCGTAVAKGEGPPQEDLAALRELRDRQDAAWASGNGAAYAAIFTADGDMVTFNGDHMSGREQIASRMQYYFDRYVHDTRLVHLSEQIRFPEPDLAIIVRTGCVLWPGETECRQDALSVNTNIALKRQGQWLYTSFQNTRIRPL